MFWCFMHAFVHCAYHCSVLLCIFHATAFLLWSKQQFVSVQCRVYIQVTEDNSDWVPSHIEGCELLFVPAAMVGSPEWKVLSDYCNCSVSVPWLYVRFCGCLNIPFTQHELNVLRSYIEQHHAPTFKSNLLKSPQERTFLLNRLIAPMGAQ